jgi:hypothetical protein
MILPHKDRDPCFSGWRPDSDILYRRSVQGFNTFPGFSEYSASFYSCNTDISYILKKGYGKICEWFIFKDYIAFDSSDRYISEFQVAF